MGKSSQRKGANGERELAEVLREYGYDIQRGGSETFGKVPDLIGLPSVHIECKRVEHLNLWEAMEQSIRDAERFQDGFPTVVFRRNRSNWLIALRLSDFMSIFKGE